MKEKLKQNLNIILIIIFFGSLWGFLEVFLGEFLRINALTADFFGRIMSVVGLILMIITRLIYKKRGHQLIIGVIAALFRLLYPFIECVPCSFTAIIAEALIFEALFFNNSFIAFDKKRLLQISSLGVIIFHLTFSLSYLVNQIFFPLFSKSGLFYLDLVILIPQTLAKSFFPALTGMIIFPFLILLKDFEVKKIKEMVFYPITGILLVSLWIIPAIIF